MNKRLARKLGCGAVAVLVVTALACGGVWALFGPRQHPNLNRLLEGSRSVTVTSVVISGQGQRINIADPESLVYLTQAFRSAEKEGYVPIRNGASYYAEMELSPAGSVLVGVSAPDGGDGLTVGYPMDSLNDPTYYWLRLPKPMPAPVAAAIEQMMK